MRLQHVILSTSIHVSQFLEARSPFTEAVIILVSTAGRVQRGKAARVRAPTFIVKHQQGVIGGRCGVVVSCLQVLWGKKGMSSILNLESEQKCETKFETLLKTDLKKFVEI